MHWGQAGGFSVPKSLGPGCCHGTCGSELCTWSREGGSCFMALLLAAAAGLRSRFSVQEHGAHCRCALSFSPQASPQTTGGGAGWLVRVCCRCRPPSLGAGPTGGSGAPPALPGCRAYGVWRGRSHLYLMHSFLPAPAVLCALSLFLPVWRRGERFGLGAQPGGKRRSQPPAGPFLGARAAFLRRSLTGATAPALLLGGAVADEA